MNDASTLRAVPASTRADMANAIRALAMDAVQKANSGHPGMPMGMAEIAVALWGGHLSHNPANPHWLNRDRFVLSNGHGSMLQYALLHLTGYALPIEEIERFRQLGSRTPGHPEHGLTPGIETTTGPLGQGFANAVGMALAEKLLAAEFNRPGYAVVDHRTYVFVGDGCLMEGISHEVASLAGTWQLEQADRDLRRQRHFDRWPCQGWFNDDTRGRFAAYGWNVIGPVDGHDVDAVDAAIAAAQDRSEATDADHCADRDRQGLAGPRGQREGARRSARRGGDRGHAQRDRLAARAVRRAGGDPCCLGRARPRAAARSRLEPARSRPMRASFPREAAELQRRAAGDLPADVRGDAAFARSTRPRPSAKPSRRARRRSWRSTRSRRHCRNCSAARPTSPAAT